MRRPAIRVKSNVLVSAVRECNVRWIRKSATAAITMVKMLVPFRIVLYNFSPASVTAPSLALVTWAAYFASTPRV